MILMKISFQMPYELKIIQYVIVISSTFILFL